MQENRIITVNCENTAVTLSVFSDAVLRVSYTDKEKAAEKNSFIVTGSPKNASFYTESTDDSFTLKTANFTVSIDKKTADVEFRKLDGKLLSKTSKYSVTPYDIFRKVGGVTKLKKTVDGERVTVTGEESEYLRTSYHAYLTVDFSEDETVFGLGGHEEGFESVKGNFIPLYQENMRIALPYMVSSLGYAYLFDCSSVITFDGTKGEFGDFYFESVDFLDFYFIADDGFEKICASYRDLTGETPMLPKWALGYVQSRERYVDQNNLLENARRYRAEGTPIDAIIQDWLYWNPSFWGDKHFDPERYPDPAAMINELHDMNMKFMISIWPNMHGETHDKVEFRQNGFLLQDDAVCNVFLKEARELYWKHANEGLFSHGVDGWWCDSSEPYDAVWQGATRAPLLERMKLSTDEFKKYLDDAIINAYSLHHSMGMYENQRKCSDKRVINLTRSGFSGQHRYGAIVWSGDISAKWETLKRQVHIAQNYIACGEGNWNADIGAFFVRGGYDWFREGDYPEGKDDLGYRELYTRWMQFGAFTPFMRSHGTDTPREVWQFGEKGEMFRDAIEKAIALRYKLLPYFYTVMAKMRFDGTMPITPLALAFPEDKAAKKATEEYMYGPSILVCPVLKPIHYGPGSTPITDPDDNITVYLPIGGWYDFYTEEYFEGGKSYTFKTAIDKIPLFVRAGAILPIAPPVKHTGELAGAEYEVRIYDGADSEFTLYDDVGDGYAYENGDYTMETIKYSAANGNIETVLSGTDKYRHKLNFRVIKA